uniref:hypothetical protein n=1 Tax=uncultured Erythrobacter sp. TaxID=263913 RepID=UPI0026366E5E|nr:hypothetical protein [uncultured Erythrobacter sp.]
MSSGPTTLSLLAAGLYALILLSVIFASYMAVSMQQRSAHVRSWMCIALFFMLLIAARLLDLENIVREELREMLTNDARYGDRRVFQSAIVAAIAVLVGVLGMAWFYKNARSVRGRRNIAVVVGLAASGAMIVLIMLRLVSLHAVDTLLYGPLKLNWVGDLGLSCTVGAAALFYVKTVRQRP